MDLTSTSFSSLATTVGVERITGFDTIDGHFISREEGEAALRSGRAVLIGGLLVGIFVF